MSRRALLLSVPDYDDPTLEIPAAKNDVLDLSTALRTAGVPDSGISATYQGLTTSRLRRAIGDFFNSGREGDDLLLYFSGHGIVFEGRRLLVPIDFDQNRPQTVTAMVSDLDIYASARSCAAASVLVFIDACRDGFKLRMDFGVGHKAAVSEVAASAASTPSVAIIHSCKEDRRSYFDKGPEGRSHFTAALCQVLREEGGPANIDGVLEKLTMLLAARGHQQVPEFGERTSGRAGAPDRILVREDVAARLDQQLHDSKWCRDLGDVALFERVGEVPALRRQLQIIVLRCEQLARQAELHGSKQRWRPRDPVRAVLSRLGLLTLDHASFPISPPEAALLLAAPHVYEAVLALADLRLAKDGDPLAPDGWGSTDTVNYMSRAWRTAFMSDERWRRRRELVRRGDPRYARDVAAWQLLRFLHRSGELWEMVENATDRRAWLGEALAAIFESAPFKEIVDDSRIAQTLSGERLVRLARLFFCSYGDVEIAYGQRQDATPAQFHVGQGQRQWLVDERKIGHLLSLVGRMTLDARRLSESPAEHVGIDVEMDAASIVSAVERLEWHRSTDGSLSLGAECFHQALDFAFGLEVAAINDQLKRLRDRAEMEGDWAIALPPRVDNRDVKPAQHFGRPVYQRPHVRLQLDPDRIRELLMGPKLYGDPRYALREVYQNALDACRYRRARELYFLTRGAQKEVTWRPRIVFRTGLDERERPYVECEDNGIGMERRHVEGLFALAGRRFADSHEFHLEKANWDEAGISFWSNSRFGIGVLAYFMLADEVVVWSRRMSDSYPGPSESCVMARILSGTDLFRIGDEAGSCPLGGTRVRMYLDGRPPELQGQALLDSISSWLALPEVPVQIVDGEKTLRLFPSGEVAPEATATYFGGSKDDRYIEFWVGEADALGQYRIRCLSPEAQHQKRESALLTALEQLWRPVSSYFLPLADGIRVGEAPTDARRRGPRFIVNLKENLAPALSVDRNSLLDWKDGLAWARREVAQHLFAAAEASAGVTMTHLAVLATHFPVEARQFVDAMVQDGASSRHLAFSISDSFTASVSSVGISQTDVIVSNLTRRLEPWATVSMERHTGYPNHVADMIRARLASLYRSGRRLDGVIGDLARVDSMSARLTSLEVCSRQAMAVLSRHLDADLPFVRTITPIHLMRAAASWELSLGETIDLVPWKTLELEPPILEESARTCRPRSELLEMLPREGEPSVFLLHGFSRARLIETAVRHEMTLGEAFDVVRPLTSFGCDLPVLEVDELSVRPNARTVQIVRNIERDVRRQGSSSLKAICVSVLLNVSIEWGASIGEVLKSARPLGILGLPVPRDILAEGDLRVDPTAKILQSKDFDGVPPLVDAVSLEHVVTAAAFWRVSIGDVLEIARPIGLLGIQLPKVPESALAVCPGQDVAELFSAELDGNRPSPHPLDALTLVDAAVTWKRSMEQVKEVASTLSLVGVNVADVAVVENLNITSRLAELIRTLRLRKHSRPNTSTSWILADAAARWGMSFAEVVEIAAPLASVGVKIPVLDEHVGSRMPASRMARLDEYTAEWAQRVSADSKVVLFVVAAQAGMSIGDVLDSPWLLPPSINRLDVDDRCRAYRPEEMSLNLIAEGGGIGPTYRSFVDPSSIVSVAAFEGVALARVLEITRHMALLGIDVPWCDERLHDIRPRSWVASLIRRPKRDASALQQRNVLSPLIMVLVADALELHPRELTSDLDALEFAGFDVAECRELLTVIDTAGSQ